MSISDCIGSVRSALGQPEEGKKPVSDEEIQRILQDLLDRHERRQAEGSQDGYGKSADELAQEAQQAAAIKKRNALINLQARVSRLSRIDEKARQATGAGKPLALSAAIESEMHGINTPVRGGQHSAQRDWHTLHDLYWGGVDQETERAGLMAVVKSGQLEDQWAIELAELSKGPDGKPGISGSKPAQDFAAILHRYQTMAKSDVNKAGGWVGDYFGYVTSTKHDPDLIRKAGYNAWVKALLAPGFDHARTFEGVSDPKAFLEGVNKALITGVHLTEGDNPGLKDAGFTGPANLAKKLSEGRVLHWEPTPQGVRAWINYQKQFGNPDILETFLGGLDRSARSVALMKRWGTNPRAEFEADFGRLEAKYRDSDTDAVTALRQSRDYLTRRFEQLDGTANMPVNRAWSRGFSIARAVESGAKLGNVALTHLSTGATKAATLRQHGVSLYEGYADFLQSFVRGRKGTFASQTTRDALSDLKADVLGQSHALTERFTLDDSLPGVVSGLAGKFMKLTGITFLMNAQKAGTELKLASLLGRNAGVEHEALKAATQRSLFKFDINKPEWDMLRTSPGIIKDEGNGLTYLTPKAAMMIPDESIEAHLRETGDLAADASAGTVTRKVGDWRSELALRLHGYFDEAAERSVVTPGIVERAAWAQGTRPGTFGGELLRSMAQFKMWPTTVIRQQLGAELYGGQTKTQAVRGLASLFVGTMALGYLRMALSDMASGKNPRNPLELKTLAAAAMQGGGLGIAGDFLFGEYSRFGHNVFETAAGPVIGGIGGDVINMWNTIKSGKDPSAEAWRTLSTHLPFVNLFYTRLAWDYLINWRVEEFLNPGFLKRSEASTKRNTGQTFWLQPSKAVQR